MATSPKRTSSRGRRTPQRRRRSGAAHSVVVRPVRGAANAAQFDRAYRPRVVRLRDGRTVTIRSVRPEDDAAIRRAFERLSPRSRYLRLMQHKRELDPQVLARGVRPQPGRECALVATVPIAGRYDIVGATRYVEAADPAACEFAITVADEWVGQGLAATLLRRLMWQARADGYTRIEGAVLPYNDAMLALARRLRFECLPSPGDASLVLVRKALTQGRRTAGRRAQ